MSTIFSSQWEGAGVTDSSTWTETGSGNLSVATDQTFQDAHTLKFTGTGTDYLEKLITGVATCAFRFAIRINASGGADDFVIMRSAGPGDMMVFAVGATTIYCYNNNGGAHVGSDFTFTANTWYQVEMIFVQNTSMKWKVWNASGNTLVWSEQTLSTGVNNNTCDTVHLGSVTGSASHTLWIDSFVSDNAAYPGPYISGGASQIVLITA